jgi:uncharacterized protein GlcG (DUF336 family)
MNIPITRSVVVVAFVAFALAFSARGVDAFARQAATNVPPQVLTSEDVARILAQAVAAQEGVPSLLRRDSDGNPRHARMHVAIVDPKGKLLKAHATEGAWLGSESIALAKAWTAVAFSSHENALSTRSIGQLSQPGGPLWQIGNPRGMRDPVGVIEFPGGLPLYKAGQLVGAIGVSGDGVEQDEDVAEAGSVGFDAPEGIRIDEVTGGEVAYTR